MWLFFVFFFKQKTAYEMRISDWSSDVCSSDLAQHQRDQQVGKRQQQRGGEQPGLQVLLRALLIVAGGGTHRQAAERRQGGHEEIGRASCRERECQYV